MAWSTGPGWTGQGGGHLQLGDLELHGPSSSWSGELVTLPLLSHHPGCPYSSYSWSTIFLTLSQSAVTQEPSCVGLFPLPPSPPACCPPTHQPSLASQTDRGRRDQQTGSQNAPNGTDHRGGRRHRVGWGVRESQTDSERLVLHLSGLAVSPCPVKRIRRRSAFRYRLGGYSVGLPCPIKAQSQPPAHELPPRCWV